MECNLETIQLWIITLMSQLIITTAVSLILEAYLISIFSTSGRVVFSTLSHIEEVVVKWCLQLSVRKPKTFLNMLSEIFTSTNSISSSMKDTAPILKVRLYLALGS